MGRTSCLYHPPGDHYYTITRSYLEIFRWDEEAVKILSLFEYFTNNNIGVANPPYGEEPEIPWVIFSPDAVAEHMGRTFCSKNTMRVRLDALVSLGVLDYTPPVLDSGRRNYHIVPPKYRLNVKLLNGWTQSKYVVPVDTWESLTGLQSSDNKNSWLKKVANGNHESKLTHDKILPTDQIHESKLTHEKQIHESKLTDSWVKIDQSSGVYIGRAIRISEGKESKEAPLSLEEKTQSQNQSQDEDPTPPSAAPPPREQEIATQDLAYDDRLNEDAADPAQLARCLRTWFCNFPKVKFSKAERDYLTQRCEGIRFSFGRVEAAFREFGQQSYWREFQNRGKITAFFKFLEDAGSAPIKTTVPEASVTVAEYLATSRSADTPQTNLVALPAPQAPSRELPHEARRWNELVPELPVKFWTRNSPAQELAEAQADPQFVEDFDRICELTKRIHEAGGMVVGFEWLLRKTKNGAYNWHSVLTGRFQAFGGPRKPALSGIDAAIAASEARLAAKVN